MVSVNDMIADLEVRHMVGVHRLGTGILRKLLPILDRADAKIVARLLARGDVLEGSFTSRRLERLLDAIRRINHDAHVIVGRELRDELRNLAAYETEFQRRLLTGAMPVAFDVVTPSTELLYAAVQARPFQGRLLKEWLTDLDANAARRVRDAVRLGVVQSDTVDQIVRRIRGTRAQNYADGVMAISRRGAEAMVRTAVSHTTAVARTELYEANSALIAEEMIVATLDTRTCPQCQALDGKRFPVGEGPKEPFHIGCRCIRIPRTKSWRELGFDIDELEPSTRASMNGQVPASMTYGEWLRKQPASVQDEALGPTRGALFRRGKLPIERFTNRAGDQLTLDQLRAMEAEAFARAGLAA